MDIYLFYLNEKLFNTTLTITVHFKRNNVVEKCIILHNSFLIEQELMSFFVSLKVVQFLLVRFLT